VPEPQAPVPVPSHSGAGTVAPTSPTPRPQGRPPVPPTLDEPDPDMPRRPLRTPAEQAAEQAAADLALLRTFGFADPHLRPDSAPVVSLTSSQDAEPEPEPDGAAQPVRFAVATPDGAPVGRAALTLLDDRGRDVAKGCAGADGRGELQAPRPGAFMLIASSVGFQAVAVAVTVAEAPADVAVTLTRSASVHGAVLGEDGPIAGARVTLVQDHEIVDAVDSGRDGGYRLEDVPAGEYGLSVAAAGCEPFAALLVVPDAAELRRDVELQSASPQVEADSAGSGNQDGGGYQDVAEVLRGGGQADPPGR
jgi:hypothetical protein